MAGEWRRRRPLRQRKPKILIQTKFDIAIEIRVCSLPFAGSGSFSVPAFRPQSVPIPSTSAPTTVADPDSDPDEVLSDDFGGQCCRTFPTNHITVQRWQRGAEERRQKRREAKAAAAAAAAPAKGEPEKSGRKQSGGGGDGARSGGGGSFSGGAGGDVPVPPPPPPPPSTSGKR